MVQATLAEGYNLFINSLPPFWKSFIGLFIIVAFISLYSMFIFKFHKWIATKNILELNLHQYNKSKHPVLGVIFYFLEYIIIMPFLVFIWFAMFTVALVIIGGDIEVGTLLIVSAAIVASIRMTSYYKKAVSIEIAKLLPINLLAVAILSFKFFNVEKILENISQIPNYLGPMFSYLLFIVILEILLRFVDFIVSIFNLREEEYLPEK